jgi:hypothetical protein
VLFFLALALSGACCVPRRSLIVSIAFGVRKGAPQSVAPNRSVGFWIGARTVHSISETTAIQSVLVDDAPDQLAFYLGISTEQEIPMEPLLHDLRPILMSLISAIGLELRELFVLTLPTEIRKLNDDGSSFRQALHTVLAWQRPQPTQEQLRELLIRFLTVRQSLSPELGRRIDVALRRYHASLSEEDVVDQVSDLWEASEILVKELTDNGRRIKGTVVSRIAFALARQIGRRKADVENRLVKPMYDLRCDVVHSAEEDERQLARMANVYTYAVRELIRFRLGLPYVGDRILDKFFDQSVPDKKKGGQS